MNTHSLVDSVTSIRKGCFANWEGIQFSLLRILCSRENKGFFHSSLVLDSVAATQDTLNEFQKRGIEFQRN